MIRYKLIFILGGPASGKGTLCSNLVKNFDSLKHVSSGDLLRHKQDLDLNLKSMMNNGKLLPSAFIGNLILSHIKDNISTDKIILLDGFPRNKENMKYFNLHMKNNFNLLTSIVLDCDDDIMLNRIIARGRLDDTELICKTRIHTYRKETEPLINKIDKNLVKHIYSGVSDNDTQAQAFKILTELSIV